MSIDTTRPLKRVKRLRAGPRYAVEGENWVIDTDSGIRSSRRPGQGGAVMILPADEIISRSGGYRIYKDMLADDQVKVCLSFKKVLVAGRRWDIKPADDSEQAQKIAKFVEWNLGQKLNLQQIFREALSAFEFGWSVGEVVWEVDKYDGELALAVKAIKHRDPQWVEIDTDAHGNPLTWRQMEYGRLIELQKNKVWHFAHEPKFGSPHGTSDLRAAYRAWWAKKFIVNFWNVYLERMGTPTTVVKYPVGASEELKTTLKSLLTGLSAKSEIMIPQGVEIDLIEAQRAGNPTYEKALQFHNNSIARAILMIGLLGAGGEEVSRGADSQSRLQLRTLFKMADDIAQSLIFSFTEQVIKPLVDFNFEHENLYPRFIWQDYGEFEGIEVADTIRQLFAAGMIDPDQEDINYVRSILGLPLRTEDDEPDEIIPPMALPPPANGTPPPPAPMNNDRATKSKGARKTDIQTGNSKKPKS
jgi:phage gp29-like protein